jgi:hypothetical protein
VTAGATLYPQNSATDPTGTLAALSYMAGVAVFQNYFQAPVELLI